jgi:hypothetical protein
MQPAASLHHVNNGRSLITGRSRGTNVSIDSNMRRANASIRGIERSTGHGIVQQRHRQQGIAALSTALSVKPSLPMLVRESIDVKSVRGCGDLWRYIRCVIWYLNIHAKNFACVLELLSKPPVLTDSAMASNKKDGKCGDGLLPALPVLRDPWDLGFICPLKDISGWSLCQIR